MADALEAAEVPHHQRQSDDHRHCMPDHRRCRDAWHAPVEAVDEQQAQHDVDAVDQHLQQHAGRCRGAPIEPAEQREVDQHEWRREHADRHVGIERWPGCFAGPERPGEQRCERDGQRDQQQSEHEAEQRSAAEMDQPVIFVARADRLRRQPRGAEPQIEAEREDDVEGERAQHQPAQQRCVAEPANDCDIDEADQWLGDEGERRGQGNRPHVPARHREGESRADVHQSSTIRSMAISARGRERCTVS